MKIKAYFLFPESDAFALRMIEDSSILKQLIYEVTSIKNALHLHKDYELCYDANNISSFLSLINDYQQDVHLAKIRKQLQTIIGNKTRNLSSKSFYRPDCTYAHWQLEHLNFTNVNAKPILAEAAHNLSQNKNEKIIIINIGEAILNHHEKFHVLIDAPHYNELPCLVSIPTAETDTEFNNWYSHLNKEIYLLFDRARFERTNHVWIKEKIYKEKSTGYFWYNDFYHRENKKHFEVFDSKGIHLGEASMEGILDQSKADPTKSISHII